MHKIVCDCCGKDGARNTFGYLCHLDGLATGGDNGGYVDFEFNSVSGRYESKDLCNKCYNDIVLESVKAFHKLKKK